MRKTLLHLGSGGLYYDGFINSDKTLVWKGKKRKLDLIMDAGQIWPYKDKSVDGIVSMHMAQQLSWRELVVAFREAYRVLKPGGVLRMGVPMVEMMDKDLDYLLGWNNINLFSFDLLERVLIERIGFRSIENCDYQQTAIEEFKQIDNRRNRGTWYLEIRK